MRITKNSQQKPNTPVQNLVNQLQGMSSGPQIMGRRTNTVYVGFTPKQMKESEKDKLSKTLPDMNKLKIESSPELDLLRAKVIEQMKKKNCKCRCMWNTIFIPTVLQMKEKELRKQYPFLNNF